MPFIWNEEFSYFISIFLIFFHIRLDLTSFNLFVMLAIVKRRQLDEFLFKKIATNLNFFKMNKKLKKEEKYLSYKIFKFGTKLKSTNFFYSLSEFFTFTNPVIWRIAYVITSICYIITLFMKEKCSEKNWSKRMKIFSLCNPSQWSCSMPRYFCTYIYIHIAWKKDYRRHFTLGIEQRREEKMTNFITFSHFLTSNVHFSLFLFFMTTSCR